MLCYHTFIEWVSTGTVMYFMDMPLDLKLLSLLYGGKGVQVRVVSEEPQLVTWPTSDISQDSM